MNRLPWAAGLFALGLSVLAAAPARAERVPMTRVTTQPSTGTRTDITVPYLTTGRSAFGAYSVAVRIYASPTVNDPRNPQARPVYNLPFYGGSQSFGDASNGAVSRPKR
jgi:hypothetical protein